MGKNDTKGYKVVTLCAHYDQNCPQVILDRSKNVKIKDDFGGEVKMTSEQWGVLVEKVKSGEIS